MRFSSWLQKELNKRDWGQSDLSRASKQAGYKLSQTQISNILNGNRKAGPDACIAIAYALGIPREEVFRARGWLLREPEDVVPPGMSPEAAEVVRKLAKLPKEIQVHAASGLQAQLDSIYEMWEREKRLSKEYEKIAAQLPKEKL